MKKIKKRKEKKEESKYTKEKELSNENEGKFTYDFVLKIIYNIMRVRNPSANTGGLKLPTILINMLGKDRICWMNFIDVAEALNRSGEHLLQYILNDCGYEGTIDGKDQAKIKARVSQSNLQKVLMII